MQAKHTIPVSVQHSNNTRANHNVLTRSVRTQLLRSQSDEEIALHHVALVGNYPPRQCGIATFTSDVAESLAQGLPKTKISVVAIDDAEELEQGNNVPGIIRQNVRKDYIDAALRLNDENVDVVCLQHEFGIYGGIAGDYVLSFLDALDAPVVITFHTILKNPQPDQRRVVSAILRRSSRIIVMASIGCDILVSEYNADPEHIIVIPHGAPDRPLTKSNVFKRQLGLAGHDVLMTFGLLSPGKGLESVIRALPSIVSRHRNVVYLIVGATHPKLLRREGQAYREHLQHLAEEIGVAPNVRFINTFLDTEELLNYVSAADVYLTPYLHEEQISSGTLAYAVAMGKPVVSTPYWHAVELLADNVGILVEFNDSEAIARHVSTLLSNNTEIEAFSQRAYARGRETIWPRSAEKYINALTEALREPDKNISLFTFKSDSMPPSLIGLEMMTDDVGIFQHANKNVPDRAQGYCLDDNARALMLIQLFRSNSFQHTHIDRLESIYSSFINHAWNSSTGRFRNFMGFDRRWRDTIGSDDSNGRAIWCLGEVSEKSRNDDLRSWSTDIATQFLQAPSQNSLRAMAFIILGLKGLLTVYPDNNLFHNVLELHAHLLFDALLNERKPGWKWFEAYLAYDNARLPQALIEAGLLLQYKTLTEAGLEALEWLVKMQTSSEGIFAPVGTESFGIEYITPAQFDQQPLEASATIDACLSAHTATRDSKWIDEVYRAYGWFIGRNVLGISMINTSTGSCYDGIGCDVINRNQGAESIISFQLSNCAMNHLND